MRVTVVVTAVDIRMGLRGESEDSFFGGSTTCPVTRGIKRLVRKNVRVEVTENEVVFGETAAAEVILPGKVTDFIALFDAERPVKPMRFVTDIPAGYLKKKRK